MYIYIYTYAWSPFAVGTIYHNYVAGRFGVTRGPCYWMENNKIYDIYFIGMNIYIYIHIYSLYIYIYVYTHRFQNIHIFKSNVNIPLVSLLYNNLHLDQVGTTRSKLFIIYTCEQNK